MKRSRPAREKSLVPARDRRWAQRQLARLRPWDEWVAIEDPASLRAIQKQYGDVKRYYLTFREVLTELAAGRLPKVSLRELQEQQGPIDTSPPEDSFMKLSDSPRALLDTMEPLDQYLARITTDERRAIRRRFGCDPVTYYRAARKSIEQMIN